MSKNLIFILITIMFFLLFLLILKFNSIFLFLFFKMSTNMNISMDFMMTKMTLIFSLIILIISIMVMIYSKIYFSYKMNFSYKINLMMFIFSMIILVNSDSFLMLILGWDGLGISSFFLISFYSNIDAEISSMITFFFNRLGDSFMLILFSIVISFSINLNNMNILIILSLMLLMSSLTKSAQLPFGTWLPMAMSAPTPISSLVHSSTLVTAGIFMIMKIPAVTSVDEFNIILMIFGIFTFIFSGFFSFFILDLKKSVAFSTLSQLGMMMFSLSLGNFNICYCHMLFHAFFKSCLFMNLGIFMMNNFSLQDLRVKNFFSNNMIFKMSYFVCCFNLMGLMTFTGFLSKELILIFFLNKNIKFIILLLLYFGCLMTVCYSLKFLFIFFTKSNLSMTLKNTNVFNIYFLGVLILSFICLILPLLMFDFFMFEMEIFLSKNFKFIFSIIILFSISLIYIILKKNIAFFMFFSSMIFMLDYLNKKLKNIFKMMMEKSNKMLFVEEFSQLNIFMLLFNKKMNSMNMKILFFSNLCLMLIFYMNLFIILNL